MKQLLRSFKTGFIVKPSYRRCHQVVLKAFPKPRLAGQGPLNSPWRMRSLSLQKTISCFHLETNLRCSVLPRKKMSFQYLKTPLIKFRQIFTNMLSLNPCSTFLSISLLFLYLPQHMYCLIPHNRIHEVHRFPVVI